MLKGGLIDGTFSLGFRVRELSQMKLCFFFIPTRKVMLFNDLSNVLHANGLRFTKYVVTR